MAVIFTFLSLWLSSSLSFLIVWYKVISSWVFSVFCFWFLYVKESVKRSRLKVSLSFLAGLCWSRKYHIISISLRFFIFASLVQGHLRVSCYLSFSVLFYFDESGTRAFQLKATFYLKFSLLLQPEQSGTSPAGTYYLRLSSAPLPWAVWRKARTQSDVKSNSCLPPVSTDLPWWTNTSLICIFFHLKGYCWQSCWYQFSSNLYFND